MIFSLSSKLAAPELKHGLPYDPLSFIGVHLCSSVVIFKIPLTVEIAINK